jgi:molecular chaperone DnaK
MSSQMHAKGIDLGTTNSEIAELRGTDVHVFRNAEGAEYTPSSVYMNSAGSLMVGRSAKDRCESDPDNAFMEFKRDMGSDAERCFARNGRRMKPEELSAEVLKSLCGDVQRATGESVRAAVITVPADFDTPQTRATNAAAQMAGISHTVLMTEPVAAAQAYSFDSQDDKTFWLVYDFGGGTFDSAIIQVRDGLIQVTGNKGDNQLGGKNIDWAIVEDLLIPAVTKDRRLRDFKRGEPHWRGAIAKLKIEAEKAKILLSSPNTTSAEISVEYLCKDDRGEPVEFEYVLRRSDVERLAAPFIRRTINVCREVLVSRRLGPSNISKLILVGGPTMMPYLRQLLKDPAEGLGIPLEFSVDPLTVVARGAAVYAASQRIAPDADPAGKAVPSGQFAVKLDYIPVGPDPDPEVAGAVAAGAGAQKDFSGYTIEFINSQIRPAWRSGKIGLGPKGTFLTNVSAEKGRENTFEIELCDTSGAIQVVTPRSFAIVVKGTGVFDDPTHAHTLGIALANNEVLTCYQKETPLPSKKRVDLRTAVSLKKGQSGQLIRVPLVEGENKRADRNRVVGTLVIPADGIARDVPAGSEIEVTVEIDKSAQIRTRALIPILGDDEFEEPMKLTSATPDAKVLIDQLQRAKDRLKDLREKAGTTGDATALDALRRIDAECMVPEVEKLVGPAASEGDAARQCQNVLNRLNSLLDEVEEALEWPALVAQVEKKLAYARKLVRDDEYANEQDGITLDILEREIREAIAHHVPDLLRRRFEALRDLVGEIVRRDPAVWVEWFRDAKDERGDMSNAGQAETLIAKGDRAISANDPAGLKDAVRGLWRLLPEEKRPQAISDVII